MLFIMHIRQNTIALTFVLPLDDKIFTRELWESATECPVVFPDGVGVVGWMVPGGREIAIKTAELMKKYDVVIWAHHGMFCSGEDFDLTFWSAPYGRKICRDPGEDSFYDSK